MEQSPLACETASVSPEPSTRLLDSSTSWLFCILTFCLSWIGWIVGAKMRSSPGESALPVFTIGISARSAVLLLANLVPGIVAIGLSLLGRIGGLREIKKQFSIREASAESFFLALTFPVLIYLVVLCAEGGFEAILSVHIADYVRMFFINIFLVPLWEELGWRGFLYRSLLGRIESRRAMLFVGLIWAAWHFPLYRVVWHVSLFAYAVNFVSIVGISFVLCRLYSDSKQSILLPAVFHGSWNSASSAIDRIQPNLHLFAALIQILIVWLTVLAVWWCLRDESSPAASR